MTPKLSQEQREAIQQHGGPVEVEDDETRKVYVIIEGDLHQRAMQALEEHDARRAIRAGIDDLQAGRIVPFAELDSRLRKKLGLPERASSRRIPSSSRNRRPANWKRPQTGGRCINRSFRPVDGMRGSVGESTRFASRPSVFRWPMKIPSSRTNSGSCTMGLGRVPRIAQSTPSSAKSWLS